MDKPFRHNNYKRRPLYRVCKFKHRLDWHHLISHVQGDTYLKQLMEEKTGQIISQFTSTQTIVSSAFHVSTRRKHCIRMRTDGLPRQNFTKPLTAGTNWIVKDISALCNRLIDVILLLQIRFPGRRIRSNTYFRKGNCFVYIRWR